MTSDNEIWKPVVDYEGLYEVSSLGRVRSTIFHLSTEQSSRDAPIHMVYTNIKKQAECNNGYLSVALSKDGVTRNILVHSIVARAFIENPKYLPCVHHKDGDKHNNCVENLEWCSYRENNLHEVYSGRNKQSISVMCVETGEEFPSMSECDRHFGMTLGSTSSLTRSHRAHRTLGLHFEILQGYHLLYDMIYEA